MAVTANTNETYDVTTIREDLSEAMASITPTETIPVSYTHLTLPTKA